MDRIVNEPQINSFDPEIGLLWGEIFRESLSNNSLEKYELAVAECDCVQERLRDTLKELSKLKFALDHAAIVAITDRKGIIRYVNETFCEISKYNRDELVGKDHRIINSGYHPREFFQNFWSTIKAGKVWKGEVKNKAKDGNYYWVHTTIVPFLNTEGKPYQYLSIRFDITDRKKAEEALRISEAEFRRQAQKLEATLENLQTTQAHLIQSAKLSSMGQLIAGIAHEINNPVNFIHGNLFHASEYIHTLQQLLFLYQQHYPQPVPEIQFLLEDRDVDFLMSDLPNLLNSMKLGASRIRNIVTSLRNFSRVDEVEMQPVDIHAGIDSTLLILQDKLKGKAGQNQINLVKEYGNLSLVTCYSNQLNQVFMNLISNAIDAVECQPNPQITITTTQISQDWVQIAIIDNGLGIPEKVQKHLFEPFFTTKPIGKGTGLGLSIAYHIVVEKHHGNLECISHLNQGVKFLISLPISPMQGNRE